LSWSIALDWESQNHSVLDGLPSLMFVYVAGIFYSIIISSKYTPTSNMVLLHRTNSPVVLVVQRISCNPNNRESICRKCKYLHSKMRFWNYLSSNFSTYCNRVPFFHLGRCKYLPSKMRFWNYLCSNFSTHCNRVPFFYLGRIYSQASSFHLVVPVGGMSSIIFRFKCTPTSKYCLEKPSLSSCTTVVLRRISYNPKNWEATSCPVYQFYVGSRTIRITENPSLFCSLLHS